VNIIGEHIDYNDGWVLPMAIPQRVSISATKEEGVQTTFESSASSEALHLNLTAPGLQDGPAWGRYVQGVLWEFMKETKAPVPGFTARITSDVPQGAGLSSSAALEVATATLLEKITGHRLEPLEKARLCQRVEHTYAGVPCGLMDQAASTLCVPEHLLLLDCVTHEFRQVPFADSDVVVLISDTGISHALADGEYALRRNQCEEALACLGANSYRNVDGAMVDGTSTPLYGTLLKRARHVVREIDRTKATVAALEAGDWRTVGEQLYASHSSLANDYEVSCPELDCLVDAARELGWARGVIGARMTGGGFGGSTVTLVRAADLERLQSHLADRFRDRFGADPSFYAVRPAAGAG
jgi:galactokinase